MVPEREYNFDGPKTLIREIDSSYRLQRWSHSGRPHVACITTNINKVKVLALILLKVSLTR